MAASLSNAISDDNRNNYCPSPMLRQTPMQHIGVWGVLCALFTSYETADVWLFRLLSTLMHWFLVRCACLV